MNNRGPWGLTSDEKRVLRLLVEIGYFNRLQIAAIVECSLTTVSKYRFAFKASRTQGPPESE